MLTFTKTQICIILLTIFIVLLINGALAYRAGMEDSCPNIVPAEVDDSWTRS